LEIHEINSTEKIDVELAKIFDDLSPMEYELKETHEFTMILPDKFWGIGSYDKWIRVGWALKNTSERLFLSWVKFSSQSPEFSWDKMEELHSMWDNFQTNNHEGLTKRSIMYWAKNNSPQLYKKVRDNTIDFYIEETLNNNGGNNENSSAGATEFDFANVLFHLFKDKYVCVSIRNNIWYEYINHRWLEVDSGNSLRLKISKDMHEIYLVKIRDIMNILHTTHVDPAHEDHKRWEYRVKILSDRGLLLKKTTWKNNIMREARELFYDKDFMNNMDVNPYLLCFNNGVIDFKEKTFRKGLPEDNISKCTKIDYIPLDKKRHEKTILEIEEFMEQLFPIEELRNYMWKHLASCLIGTNDNQTFNIYTGSGANGKSKLVDLMAKALGDYKATVPITLVTQKRNNIGSTSSSS